MRELSEKVKFNTKMQISELEASLKKDKKVRCLKNMEEKLKRKERETHFVLN